MDGARLQKYHYVCVGTVFHGGQTNTINATDYAIAMQQRVIDLNVSDLLASLPYDMKPYLIMVVRPPGSCLSSHTA